MNVIPMCPKLKIPHSQAATWSSCPESMNFFSRNRSAPGEVLVPATELIAQSLSPIHTDIHSHSVSFSLSRSRSYFLWRTRSLPLVLLYLGRKTRASFFIFLFIIFFLWVFSLFLLFQIVLSHFYLVDGDERKMVWTSGEPVSALRSMFDFFGAVVLRLPASRCDRYFNRSLILSVLAV